MNKHFYRLIFNKARGMVMVVAEIVKRHQGEGRSSQKAKASLSLDKKMTAALKPLSFLTFVALGMVSVVAQSNANTIIADSNANQSQQASIIDRANGPTVVNIQEANQAGVSHNKYTQFDVSKEGVILNNNAQSSNTTLGGNIAGNSNLASSGGAKVILNEINSQNASQLNGRIEVAGQKAQVVIANAAGITCNGCGFINADRATLTTGKLIIGEDGKLNGYQVEQGNITINGAFDSSQQDYTDLIARAVNINDKIQAKNLTVIAGKNKVSHDLQTIDKLASNDTKPELAIDVAALGGMYAGKIKLVSTEGGVGVRNAGYLEQDTIDISADGQISNSGTISGTNVNIHASQNINNAGVGSIYGKNIVLVSAQEINNQATYMPQYQDYARGVIMADNSVNLSADNITNQGTIQGDNSIAISVKDIENDYNIKTRYNGNGNILIIASGRILNPYYGNITSENVSLNGVQAIINSGGTISANNLILNSDQTITNYGGGRIYSNNFDIKAIEFVNRANIGSNSGYDQTMSMYIDGKLTNEQSISLGSEVANNITVTQDINNKGANSRISGTNLNLVSLKNINNNGSISANKNLTVQANDVFNTNIIKTYYNDLTIIADGKIDNSGTIDVAQNIKFAVNTLDNKSRGTIQSKYGNIDIGGKLDDNGQVTGRAAAINNISSTISAGGSLTINADKINNTIKTVDVLIEDKNIKEWSFADDANKRYSADEVIVDNDDIDSDVLHLKVTGTEDDTTKYNYYDYNQKTYKVNVLDSQSAKIKSTGKMTLSASEIINERSTISGRALSTSVGITKISNNYNILRKVVQEGTQKYTYDIYDSDGNHISKNDLSAYNANFYK
ncbi:filamentous hemagglutinin N-terminal domain-containing protein [Orbus wheelerorum]|uniref:two-partner secretion domain-containing protein n=1 Tax=Orbus wheelerorum TaxID=3074111 RepID=UPI00370D2EC0